MKHRNIHQFACMIALALLLLLTACAPGGDGAGTNPPEEGTTAATTAATTVAPESNGTPAPDVTLLNSDGKEVKLSDFFGKPIVLNFWASWCPPCKAELPDFDKACRAYEGKVTFLMVNLTDGQRETVEGAKSFIEDKGYTFPVYFDTKYEASYKYGLSSIPQTFFLDANGNVVAQATGMITAAQLEQGIGMIYGE
jgi:thiol-disulfide isomerase/thioredoxin